MKSQSNEIISLEDYGKENTDLYFTHTQHKECSFGFYKGVFIENIGMFVDNSVDPTDVWLTINNDRTCIHRENAYKFLIAALLLLKETEEDE